VFINLLEKKYRQHHAAQTYQAQLVATAAA